MKFADGFWLNQRGYEVNYANQAFEIEEIENGFLVVATPFVVYNRAMMLGSANLEIAYTSTQENCVKVSITHHKGHVDNGPHFVLEDKGFKPQVTVTDKEAVLVTGDTKLVVSKENWSFTYYYKDKKLTSGGWRSTGVIFENAYKQQARLQTQLDDTFWSYPADPTRTYIREQFDTSVGEYFYGFGEKSGEINKAEKYMNMAPGDAMGYNAKETDSLYKHIPFYIRLNRGTKQAVGYFYHNTAECDFNMGREKRNYWHRYSSYRTDAGDIDLFLIAGPSIREIIERYTDLTGKSVMLPKAALGYLGSSMYYPELPENSDDAVLDFIDTTREEGIPADGFQLSSGYCAVETAEGIKRCTFTWNHKRFKDPADWFAQMEKRGIVVSPNIKPGMLLVHPLLNEMKEKGMFLPASDDNAGLDGLAVGTWWGGPGLFVDYTKESTRGPYSLEEVPDRVHHCRGHRFRLERQLRV